MPNSQLHHENIATSRSWMYLLCLMELLRQMPHTALLESLGNNSAQVLYVVELYNLAASYHLLLTASWREPRNAQSSETMNKVSVSMGVASSRKGSLRHLCVTSFDQTCSISDGKYSILRLWHDTQFLLPRTCTVPVVPVVWNIGEH